MTFISDIQASFDLTLHFDSVQKKVDFANIYLYHGVCLSLQLLWLLWLLWRLLWHRHLLCLLSPLCPLCLPHGLCPFLILFSLCSSLPYHLLLLVHWLHLQRHQLISNVVHSQVRVYSGPPDLLHPQLNKHGKVGIQLVQPPQDRPPQLTNASPMASAASTVRAISNSVLAFFGCFFPCGNSSTTLFFGMSSSPSHFVWGTHTSSSLPGRPHKKWWPCSLLQSHTLWTSTCTECTPGPFLFPLMSLWSLALLGYSWPCLC